MKKTFVISLMFLVSASTALAQPAADAPHGDTVTPLPSAAPLPSDAPASPTPDAFWATQPARLDYSDGSFFLRSINDNLVLIPSGRVHTDVYSFAGNGVSDYHKANGTGLKTNLFFRRFVMELGGIVRNKWFFWIGGNFAPTTVDANQAPISSANVYDGFIAYMPVPNVKIYMGQYNAPYTMENVTSSRWLDFAERALIVRTVATPYNKAEGFMLWGEHFNKGLEYQLGVFGGDGMNRQNVDNRFDGMGRIVVRPLPQSMGALSRAHIGGGGRVGSRDSDFVRYDAPGLSTPGGYTFWSPSYGSGADEVHIMPSGTQLSVSGELYVPFERWDFKGELVYVNEHRREALAAKRNDTLRQGTFGGLGGYAQVSWWVAGTPRINGNPAGYYGVSKVPKGLGVQAEYGVQLLARAELMRLSYKSADRSGPASTGLYGVTDNIDVNAWQLAANYWATKHVRLTLEYSLYQFPNVGNNQALAPGRRSDPASDASSLHEVNFRVGLAL